MKASSSAIASWFPGANADASARAAEDDRAWRACLAELGPRLLLFARQWVRCPADAEDIVQEAFVRCWRRRRGRAAANPALFFAAVRSSALDFLRREGRRQQREARAAEETPTAEPACCFETPAESAERAARVEESLSRLPTEQREVLVLKIWSELTFSEVAQVLAIPPDTAASRFRYALAALRKQLKPGDFPSHE